MCSNRISIEFHLAAYTCFILSTECDFIFYFVKSSRWPLIKIHAANLSVSNVVIAVAFTIASARMLVSATFSTTPPQMQRDREAKKPHTDLNSRAAHSFTRMGMTRAHTCVHTYTHTLRREIIFKPKMNF